MQPLRLRQQPRMVELTGPEEAEPELPKPSPLSSLADSMDGSAVASGPEYGSAACAAAPTASERRRSAILAGGAVFSAACLYAFQRTNPVNPSALLQLMEARSPSLPDALATGKPVVVEFYAPWCIECRESAPAMMRIEKRYGDKVGFVTINGDDPRNAELVRLFGVDGIPHVSMIGSDRKLKATLIGAAPESVVEKSVEALFRGEPMPYGGEQQQQQQQTAASAGPQV